MNPYEVLGVSENADAETIKKAYKELVKKYHPDKYVNNPLADLAAEKMKEINKAYDMLTKNNAASTGSGGTGGYSGGGYGAGGFGGAYQNIKPTFQMVRQLVSMRQYTQAQLFLQQLPKTAEWYYLNGIISIGRGWYTQGIQSLEQAVKMDPDNVEYSDMLNNVKNRSTAYNTGGGAYTTGTDCCSAVPCYCLPCFCPGSCCC